MLGGRPWDEWIAQYGHSHEHPVNRFCHTIGIPLIVGSLLVGAVAIAVPGLWWTGGGPVRRRVDLPVRRARVRRQAAGVLP